MSDRVALNNRVTSMGGARDFEKLVGIYDHLDKTKLADRSDTPKLRQSTGDPDQDAKLLVQDLMPFFMLLGMEFGASPETLIYAAELFALNVVNAKDCPLDKAMRNQVRKRAFDYYAASLEQIPDVPAKPPRR